MSIIPKGLVVKTQSISKPTLKEVIYKYLSYYPLFVISFVICLGLALLYVNFTVPKYNTSALILVKSASVSSSQGSNDLVDKALSGGVPNLQNDIMLLRSTSLMKKVVQKNNLNISYYKAGKFVQADIYHDAPFRLMPQFTGDMNSMLDLSIANTTTAGCEISYGAENNEKYESVKWNVPFLMNSKKFVLVPNGKIQPSKNKYKVTVKPVDQAANELSKWFSVTMNATNNTIIELSLLTENLERGKEVLDGIVSEFIEANIEDKKKIAKNTISFIDDRLNVVSKQLGGVEGDLESFQGKSKLIIPEQQSTQGLNNSQDVSKSLSSLEIQKNVVSMVRDYVKNPSINGNSVPSTLGLNDPTLASLVTKYNELQLRKEREAPLNAPNSLVIKDLDNQSATLKSSILESLDNITNNLNLQENGLQKQNSKYNQFINSLPGKERNLQEIKRQQNITEGLYLYLLQKREESALSTSSTISNYQQVDPATGYGPVDPDFKTILELAILLGMLLPVGIIYIRDALNDKITSRTDINEKVQLPITGEVGHIKNTKNLEEFKKNKRLIEEQFQIIRTNIFALHKKRDRNIFLVTSTASGEGKSLISLNLATVLAKSGKKVALLQFDLRKPDTVIQEMNNEKGLSDYLSGEITELSKLYTVSGDIPTLHMYSSGSVHQNPADLLTNEQLAPLFETLKCQYDCVIVNSAPVGYVGDALILGEYSDAVIYVIRQRYTNKKHLSFIDDIAKTGKLNNMYLVVNDVKFGSKYDYYGYGQYYTTGRYQRN